MGLRYIQGKHTLQLTLVLCTCTMTMIKYYKANMSTKNNKTIYFKLLITESLQIVELIYREYLYTYSVGKINSHLSSIR